MRAHHVTTRSQWLVRPPRLMQAEVQGQGRTCHLPATQQVGARPSPYARQQGIIEPAALCLLPPWGQGRRGLASETGQRLAK